MNKPKTFRKAKEDFDKPERRAGADASGRAEGRPFNKDFSKDSRKDSRKDSFKDSWKEKSGSAGPRRRRTSDDEGAAGDAGERRAGNRAFGKAPGRPAPAGGRRSTGPKRANSPKAVAKSYGSAPQGPVRLNKYLANAGITSRRDADTLIQEGKVTVNGKVVTELGFKVDRNDTVKYEGKLVKPEKMVYLLLNKPKDFITTVSDPQNRRTVMKLVANACQERIYPVGRLDRNTSGLLLFTNDGDLAKKLSHPSHMVKKIYYVELNKPLKEDDLVKIQTGIELEDGPVKPDDIQVVSPDGIGIGIEIHVGKNRIVRRIFEHMGYDVVKLDRVMYGGLTKKDLPRGKWRMLTQAEINLLKNFQ